MLQVPLDDEAPALSDVNVPRYMVSLPGEEDVATPSDLAQEKWYLAR
jgi:hypothetical protein